MRAHMLTVHSRIRFGLVVLFRVSTAHGQPAESPTAVSNPATSPPAETAEAARILFREGAQRAEEGRWLEARDRFRRALAVRPSALLHYNHALASQNSGYLVEAVDQYRLFLRLDADPTNSARRDHATRAITTIEPVLARLILEPSTEHTVQSVSLDGRELPLALLGAEIPLDPGEHFVDAISADGLQSSQVILLQESQRATRTLRFVTPPSTVPPSTVPPDAGAPAVSPSPVASPIVAPRRPPTAPLSTIGRIRRALEDNAREVDPTGARPWERTFVIFAQAGTGHTAGILALGARWAARPWYEVEANLGAGHPFGPGVAFFPVVLRAPWSYQFASSLLVGIGTNFTEIQRGTSPPVGGSTCQPTGPFTPMWLIFGIGNEFRIMHGAVAARITVGVRHLVNNQELVHGIQSRCGEVRTSFEPRDLLYDTPNWDHSVVPLLPWFAFDAGYAL
ncbi:MAG: hypothetical protein Q8Q09_09735 [Deltaproteobacteria bacterium]|nr:hypothetical protein [Deltaproteobacteria bacterium]